MVDNSQGRISTFKMSRADLGGQDFSIMAMSDFKAQKFSMLVDGQTYDVYPDTASIVAPGESKYI